MHLFLYAEEEMSQVDFLREKHRLHDNITRLQGDIEKEQQASIFAISLTDEEFLQKAARLLFQDAMAHGNIDFPTLAMRVGNPELKKFINAVVEQIVVLDGHITQITFANGETHTTPSSTNEKGLPHREAFPTVLFFFLLGRFATAIQLLELRNFLVALLVWLFYRAVHCIPE